MPVPHEPTLIVGAGPIGLACAISAKRRGLDPLVIDAGAIADSIVHYPVGMHFFTTPERLEIGGHPIVCSGPKPTREEALMYYRGVARAEGLRIRPYTRLTGLAREEGRLVAELAAGLGAPEPERLACDQLVLATGYFGHPNLLGVPGESLPHVSHYPGEPHLSAGLDVVVVGGKNSAVEMALGAYRAGARVTLVHRRSTLKPSVKYWLRPDLENRIKAGEIRARWSATVTEIGPRTVTIRPESGDAETLPADRVYLLTGYHPDFDLFRRLGLELDPETGKPTHNPATLESNVPGVYPGRERDLGQVHLRGVHRERTVRRGEDLRGRSEPGEGGGEVCGGGSAGGGVTGRDGEGRGGTGRRRTRSRPHTPLRVPPRPFTSLPVPSPETSATPRRTPPARRGVPRARPRDHHLLRIRHPPHQRIAHHAPVGSFPLARDEEGRGTSTPASDRPWPRDTPPTRDGPPAGPARRNPPGWYRAGPRSPPSGGRPA